jgi:hypothetical protein
MGGMQVKCRVNDGSGNPVTSNIVTLYVYTKATTITTQPVNRSVKVNASTTFTVAATGDGTLAYQWQYQPPNGSWANFTNGTAVAGATPTNVTTTSMTIKPTSTASNGYKVRCRVTSPTGGVAYTNAVTLTVTN